ncbi:hypothetical protein [Allosphingosinicella vermicomposti]|uniref:hypothetical protein n=1 Tax=Allosphingosinicella vermicomposti TaxID=614671 RepID=UPI000D11284C|nr:hypothetical protein [Allosphingosinicella vermicomposti]
MSVAAPFEAEPTAAGAQCLVPGVRPISQRARLEAQMAAPLVPQRPQKATDFGLFDEAARLQLDLFGVSGRTSAPDRPP